MKYWTQNGNDYELTTANANTKARFLIGGLCLAFGLLAKWVNADAGFYFFGGLGLLLIIFAFTQKGQKTTLNTTTKMLIAPKMGMAAVNQMGKYPLQNFVRMEVVTHRVEYLVSVPSVTAVVAHFKDHSGNETAVQLHAKPFTAKTDWAQALIDETEQLIQQYKN